MFSKKAPAFLSALLPARKLWYTGQEPFPKKRRKTGVLYGTAETSAFFLSREVYYTMGPRTFQRGF